MIANSIGDYQQNVQEYKSAFKQNQRERTACIYVLPIPGFYFWILVKSLSLCYYLSIKQIGYKFDEEKRCWQSEHAAGSWCRTAYVTTDICTEQEMHGTKYTVRCTETNLANSTGQT